MVEGTDEYFDGLYTNGEAYFGVEPDRILIDHAHLLDITLPVLDVGVGQGRNAFFLAGKGYTVHGIDPSAVSVETVANLASERGLPISAYHARFEQYEAEPESYSGVLAFGIIQILDRGKIDILCKRIGSWLVTGGLAYITAWTVDDPWYPEVSSEWSNVGRNSFQSPDGRIRTFLDRGELPAMFPGFEIVHHLEDLGPFHRHSGGPLERHGRVDAILRKN